MDGFATTSRDAPLHPAGRRSDKKLAKVLASHGQTQLVEGFTFDLPDTFTCEAYFDPDLLQRQRIAQAKPVTQLKDAPLSVTEFGQDAVHFLAKYVPGRRVNWILDLAVGHEISQGSVTVLADRRFQRKCPPAGNHDLVNPFGGHARSLGYLVKVWSAPEFLFQARHHIPKLGELFNNMYGQPDRP